MTDICIPISHLGDNQIAEVLILIGGLQKRHNFKVEAFPWDIKLPVEERINILKRLRIMTRTGNWSRFIIRAIKTNRFIFCSAKNNANLRN